MQTMSEKPPKKSKPKVVAKRERKSVFLSLDDETDAALDKFRADQRVVPERPAVAFTALVEFLRREGYLPGKPA